MHSYSVEARGLPIYMRCSKDCVDGLLNPRSETQYSESWKSFFSAPVIHTKDLSLQYHNLLVPELVNMYRHQRNFAKVNIVMRDVFDL